MQICFVSKGGVRAYLMREEVERTDLTLFCFEEQGIDYGEELRGKTHLFEDIAYLSKRDKNTVLCGVRTAAYGQIRNSVVVAEKGKILGVADMTRSIDGEVGSGTPLKVFDTASGRIGVIVADDLYFTDTARALCDCGAETLVCLLAKPLSSIERVLLRATAFFYGVPVLSCGKGGALIADAHSTEVLFTPFSPAYASFEGEKEYHLVSVRKRGFFL